jgi:hypothetical protein
MSPEEQMRVRFDKAANNLHHLSMRYVGALHEVAMGKQVGFVDRAHPGSKEMRDLIDLILFVRAELNGISRILIENKICTEYEITRVFAEEFEHFTKVKAQQLNVVVSDMGLVFRKQEATDN